MQQVRIDGMYYWLGSPCFSSNTNRGNFVFQYVVGNLVASYYSYGSNLKIGTTFRGIRPVVTLSSEITFTDSGTKRDGCTLWNIE